MTRLEFLRTLAAASAPARRPNVLFLAVDDLRPEFGAYGAAHVVSPHLDRLARSGTRFTRAYCQSALCNPSRASMLTGLRPDTLGVHDLQTDFRKARRPEAVTLPQCFKQQGYRTIGLGKIFHNIFPDAPSWHEDLHIDGYPFDPDAVYRSPEEVARLAARQQQIRAAGNERRFIDRYGQWYLKSGATEAPDVPDDAYYDGAQTTLAIGQLAKLAAAREPFFFGIGYYRPHLPFNAPKRYWDLYDPGRLPLPANGFLPRGAPPMAGNMNRELRGYRDFTQAPRPDQGPLSEAEIRRLRHGYYASVSYVDAQIGRLLDTLERTGLAANTIVVLWGDHGWKLGEHAGWGKMTEYETDTRIPLVIRAPGLKPGVCPGLVESIDLFPTLCELAGLRAPAGLEGASLVPLLRNPRRRGKDAAFSQFLRGGIWTAADGVVYHGRSIHTERHRYAEWRRQDDGRLAGVELYDLRADPAENVNLAGDPRHRALEAGLARRLETR